jgi:hypothetical protein
LHQQTSRNPLVGIEPIQAPAPARVLQPLAPQIVVVNGHDQTSEGFRVGYQILQGDQILVALEQEEAPLAGQGRREIVLPTWEPAAAGDLHIRFGVGDGRDAELEYGPSQDLHVLTVGAPFEAVVLEGSLTQGHGAGLFDYDSDGDLDLYLVRLGGTNQLFANQGTEFVERAEVAGLAHTNLGRGLAVGDYDGDGDLDLYLVNQGTNRFLRNGGNGTFADITDGLDAALGAARSSRSAGFFDADADGDLDLYLVIEGTNRFFRNEQGTFSEQAVAAGLALAGGAVDAVFGDYDGDGDADLFVANEEGPNQLWRNEEDISFRDITALDSLYPGAGTSGSAFFDYDNDGDVDLATTASSTQTGGDQVYHRRDQHLLPVGHLLELQTESNGRALSFGDVDGDGDVDLFIADHQHSRLYRNRAEGMHWLQVDLAGIDYNRQGLGARVEMVAGEKRQYREVQSGNHKDVRVYFGLGESSEIDTLRVRWPDGQEVVHTQVGADQLLQVRHPDLMTAILDKQSTVPDAFALQPNYPNPFNARTLITYQLPHKAAVTLTVYNIAGQPVRKLVRAEQQAGYYQVSWEGRDKEGRSVGSGVYLVRLIAGSYEQTRRLLLLR